MLTDGLVADLSESFVDKDRMFDQIAESLSSDTQQKMKDDVLSRYATTHASIVALSEAYTSQAFRDDGSLQDDAKRLVDAASRLGTLHWHLILLHASQNKLSLIECAEMMDTAIDEQDDKPLDDRESRDDVCGDAS